MKRPPPSHKKSGATLAEMLVVLAIFSTAMTLIALILTHGFQAVSMASARHDVEVSLDKAYFWLKRDLEVASINRIARKRISLAGGGDAIWFQTAVDPQDSNPKTNFKKEDDGTPKWAWHILYYLARPKNYSLISGGLNPAIDPDPEGDFFSPHKFLIRKVIKPTATGELLNDSQIESYITSPNDYSLSDFKSEGNVLDYKLVADKLLSMQTKIVDNALQVSMSAVHLDPKDRSLKIGQTSLKDSPERRVRLMSFLFEN